MPNDVVSTDTPQLDSAAVNAYTAKRPRLESRRQLTSSSWLVSGRRVAPDDRIVELQ